MRKWGCRLRGTGGFRGNRKRDWYSNEPKYDGFSEYATFEIEETLEVRLRCRCDFVGGW
jgi:hypothetical protein